MGMMNYFNDFLRNDKGINTRSYRIRLILAKLVICAFVILFMWYGCWWFMKTGTFVYNIFLTNKYSIENANLRTVKEWYNEELLNEKEFEKLKQLIKTRQKLIEEKRVSKMSPLKKYLCDFNKKKKIRK